MKDLLADLRAAAAVWRRRPELLVVETVITIVILALIVIVPDLDPEVERTAAEDFRIFAIGIGVSLVVAVPQVAWIGAQRVVYAEAFQAPESPGRDGRGLLALARDQTRRFYLLGLLLYAGLFPVLTVSAGESLTTVGGVMSMLALLTVDVLLTFVTPALALSTRSIRVALGVGWRLLRRHWPAADWHAVLPPVLLTMHTFLDLPERFASSITLLLVPLLVAVRGAVVRLYLRLPHEQITQEVTEELLDRAR